MVASALVAGLSGCASFSPDAGMDTVNQIAAPELGTRALKVADEAGAAEARARTRRLLGSSLSVRSAARLALLNNKGLQAAFNELGIAEAAMIEAILPPNPSFTVGRIATPVELDIESKIIVDILALATLPTRAEIAADRFRLAQLRAAQETLRLGATARRSYYRAVAALQLADALAQAVDAADTSAKLAKQLADTGAMNKLDLAREQAYHAELAAQLDAARQRVEGEREHLIRVMGVESEDTRFTLPHALSPVPKRAREAVAVETEAVRRRIDVQIARLEIEAVAKSYGLTQATRFINLLDVAGVARTQREAGGASGTGGGVEVEFQIPIFDFGEVRLYQAGETYMAAVNRLSEKVINVRSEARQAYGAYRAAFMVADRYRNAILPLRKTIADETALRYGAMQIDVFALLTEARQRIAVNIAAIEAQRDFWLAEVDLGAVTAGGGSVNADPAGALSVRALGAAND
jgi:outer membrane protein TolC